MGLPIRIPAVLFTYNFPQRFAVRRVLLRLLVPRHPLCALFSLTFFSTSFFHFITLFYLLFKDLFSFGGAKRDRTADLLLAKQALSQLSYSPTMVPRAGVEPARLYGAWDFKSHVSTYSTTEAYQLINGVPYRTRICDLSRVRRALYRLSYASI